LDSHMGVYHFNDAIFEAALGLAKEFGCTLRVAFPHRKERLHAEGFPCVDRLFYETYDVPDAERFAFYTDLLKNLEPGLSELIVHCGTDDAELDAITEGLQKRRALDAEFFSLDSTARLLKELGVQVLGYSDLKKLLPR
ncbi:MAG: ChbG/HpnK family deacetylase, partial [Candidatus Methylomirabilis sp.]|nr:ChbG/HpnK family deacetylase [Deltaproteobacteria bacterium]